MKAPDLPANEAARLAELRDLDILDSLPEDAYDDMTKLAAKICGVPIALVSLIDEDRQWFKARVGMESQETSRAVSFCGHAVASGKMLLVEDVRGDDRFADNPLVTGAPHVGFYAGTPLETEEGLTLGTLCVIDHVPRRLTQEQLGALEALGRQVGRLLAGRRREKELHRARQAAEVASAALVRARDDAMEASRAKSEFLATMSHELRTPLNSVIGFANILLKNKAQTFSSKDIVYLDRILANGRNLLALINDVLDLSKIEASRLDLEIVPVDANALIEEVVSQFESQAEASQTRVTCVPDPRMREVRADRLRLKQVLTNLVGNAIKFTLGGRVEVRAVAEAGTGRPLRLDIVDSGIGIPRDKQALVFEAFRQADSSTARQFGGTGLGLAISRSLTREMTFDLVVDSVVGAGSTFSVLLAPDAAPPVHRQPAEAASPSIVGTRRGAARPAEIAHGRAYTVLLVDDDVDARTLLEQQLADYGCQLIAVDTGQRGIEVAVATRPDLIVLDLLMPGMDGWEVLRQLGAGEATRGIPVVLCSNLAGEQRASIAGATAILQKPVEAGALASLLEEHLVRQGPVLIVDDDADSVTVVEEALRQLGTAVIRAANGALGLEMIDATQPRLIILDLAMPVMDGFAFLKALRDHPVHRDLPVVVCTARSLSATERSAIAQQTQGWIDKKKLPIDEIRSLVEPYLRRGARE